MSQKISEFGAINELKTKKRYSVDFGVAWGQNAANNCAVSIGKTRDHDY